MNEQPQSIPKQLDQKPALDFFALRREGIGYIAEMGSRFWTDYNTHDPGITLLEAFCYALTDLAYRCGWDMQDLLTQQTPAPDPDKPYPQQAFFSAREILTVNPVSAADFRRLLIDLQAVRNAWIFSRHCACDVPYYAWCEQDERLALGYKKPDEAKPHLTRIDILGFYDVLLELENDPELGDLNDRKIKKAINLFDDAGKHHPLLLELRFPEQEFAELQAWQWFLQSEEAFTATLHIGASKGYDVLTDPLLDEDAKQRYLNRHWRDLFYLDFELLYSPGAELVKIADVSLRLFGDSAAQRQTDLALLENALSDASPSGFIALYRLKALEIIAAVDQAKLALHQVRDLDEDYCRIAAVGVEDIAVCADIEVAADADIDRVQAEIWFKLEQYLNPPVPFYSLQELLDEAMPVEDIFNGPALSNGFIKAEDLDKAELRSELRTSDIVNRLMRIDGVIAVNNLLLTGYAADGSVIKGKADPVFNDGVAIFDGKKVSAAWLLFVEPRRQPRLYREQSRFLFFKNGLPFQPRIDEALDTLVQLRGESERPKLKNASNDLAMPKGSFRRPADYFPVQYSLPQTYATGPAGLPSHASIVRRAQARQLKAYLLVFEQILANQNEQLAHVADLFSLDSTVEQTYFGKLFSETSIVGYDDLVDGLDADQLKAITETPSEFLQRRNRFLDHLLARFGEQFSEYALLLTELAVAGQQKAGALLIDTKLAFLRRLPEISGQRYRAFDYRKQVCSAAGNPVLKQRVALLLGYPDLFFSFNESEVQGGVKTVSFELTDAIGRPWLTGALEVDAEQIPERQTYRAIIRRMSDSTAYEKLPDGDGFKVLLKDEGGENIAETPNALPDQAAAQEFIDTLLGWSANERAIVVEHVLLRPKFPGDALYPACVDGLCRTCGDEDPYSFRLTWVMPGWLAAYTNNLELRDFADRSIRRETPAHLLSKICWVGNSGFSENPCDPIVVALADKLIENGLTEEGQSPTETEACACATGIFQAYSQVFRDWYQANRLVYFHADALQALLQAEFRDKLAASNIECTVELNPLLWEELETLLLDYFVKAVLYGSQFERFELAWCEWLEANAKIDWLDVRLNERVSALLAVGADPEFPIPTHEQLCKQAAVILADYAEVFHQWMHSQITAGNSVDEDGVGFGDVPQPVIAFGDLHLSDANSTKQKIKELLIGRKQDEIPGQKALPGFYPTWVAVSYRLWRVVTLLAELKNIYPEATLHDCDDGSDVNPVRLDQTALGTFGSTQGPFETL